MEDKKMKKKIAAVFCLSIFTMLICFSLIAHAEGDHKKGQDGHCIKKVLFHRFHSIIKNQDSLNISDKQISKIKELKISIKKDLIKQNAEIDIVKLDMKLKLWDEAIDKKGLNKLIDKKFDLKKDKEKLLVDTYIELNNILTGEQKKKLQGIMLHGHKAKRCNK